MVKGKEPIMKYTVNITVTMSVEVDSDEIKKEFGKVNNRLILEEAKGRMSLDNMFDSKAVIVNKYADLSAVKIPKKGISSY
jgi:hypothetical protein